MNIRCALLMIIELNDEFDWWMINVYVNLYIWKLNMFEDG